MLDEQAGRSLFLAPPKEPERPVQADEPPAGPAAPLAEVEEGRRRWLAVLVVLALLVAGAAANRRSAQQPAPPPEEPQTAAPQAVPEPVLLAPSLRTMSRQPVVAALPAPTETTLAIAASTQVILLEVDSGTARNVQIADLEASGSYPWGSQVLPVGDRVVIRSQPPRAFLLPRADGGPVEPLEAGSGGGLYPSQEPGRYWVDERRGEAALQELDLAGEVSGAVPVLDGVESIVWDGSGFIQTAGGRALSTPEDGEPVPVAAGTAIAATREKVALLRCEGGQGCALEVLDRSAGTTRTIAPPRRATSFILDGRGRISPDGRWLLVSAGEPAGGDGRPREEVTGLAIVDLDSDSDSVRFEPVADAGGEPAVGAFSPSSRWLFLAASTGTVNLDIAAIDLEAERRHALTSLEVRSGFGLVLEAFAASPADLGAAGS